MRSSAKKRLPLEGKLATKLTDEVFRETNAMRSSDPQKQTLSACPPHPASLTLRHLLRPETWSLRVALLLQLPVSVAAHLASSATGSARIAALKGKAFGCD